MSSLRRQLGVGLALGLVLILAGFWLVGSQAIRAMTEQFVLSRLGHDSDALLTALSFDASGQARLDHRLLPPLFEQPYSGHYFRLSLDDGSQLSSRSTWDFSFEVPSLPPGESSSWRMTGPAGQLLLVSSRGYRKDGRNFTLAVTEDLAPLERQLRRFQWLFAGLSLAALVLLLLIQGGILARGFAWLKPVRERLRQLETGESLQVSESVPEEIRPLVRQINRLLGLMQQRLQHGRNSLGNLAHALKGPINLALQQIDSELLDDRASLRDDLRAQLERVAQLVERELKRARMAGQGMPGVLFNPQREMPVLIAMMRRMYRDRSLDIGADWPQVDQLPYDREDLHELLGNLLDNACKWAASRVRVELQWGDALRIRVEDDGLGVDDPELAELAVRGARADESVAGHGLGLSIVADLVQGYGGNLSFERSAGMGGLRVELLLPAPLKSQGVSE